MLRANDYLHCTYSKVNKQMKPIIEKIVLFLITAGLTGFLIPVVTQNIAHKQLLEQRLYETELARGNAIIEAQVKLIDNLSDLLWEYQLLAIDVTYYQPHEDQTNYVAALAAYDAKTGDVLGNIRSEISKSLRLTSLDTYNLLIQMYYSELIEVDVNLRMLIEGDTEDWLEFNQYLVYELSAKVDQLIYDLGVEMELTPYEE